MVKAFEGRALGPRAACNLKLSRIARVCEAITARKRARARADSVAREARAVIVRAGEHEDAFEKVEFCGRG